MGILSRFSSHGGFACHDLRLISSTGYSVSPRRCHFSVSAIASCSSHGILTVSAIALAVRLRLRTRLTPGWLALPGKPWSCGGRESHPPYRYLYLHLLFHALQPGSSPDIRRTWNAPLPILLMYITIPHLRCLPYTRLLSTPGPSTSELLRTLWMNGCFQANILAVTGTGLR